MGTDIKRLHYFNGQFLKEPDFTDEQAYHMDRRRRHNSLLHTWGVAQGLTLSYITGEKVVTVSEGVAFDAQGREIVLANDFTTPELPDGQLYITIAYAEQEADAVTLDDVTGDTHTRWTETPDIEVSATAPVSGDVGVKLILGRVTVNSGEVTGFDDGDEPNKRHVAGVVGGDLQVSSLILSAPSITSAHWTKVSLGAEGRADVAGNLRVRDSVEIGADLTITGMLHGANIVGTGQIQGGSVGTSELADNAVTSAKLQSDPGNNVNRAVSTNHIQDNAITSAKILDGSVTAAKILDGNVGTVELANNAVTSAKLQSDPGNNAFRAVTTNHIQDNAITNAKILDGSVNAAKIQDGTVGTAELANGAVTSAKLQSDATGNNANRAVSTDHIQDNAITGAKILDGTVGTSELANNAVTSLKLQSDPGNNANRAVTASHIQDNAVTTAKIPDGAITGPKLGALAVSTSALQDSAVLSAEARRPCRFDVVPPGQCRYDSQARGQFRYRGENSRRQCWDGGTGQ